MKVLYGLPPEARTATYQDWTDALHPADFAQAQREITDVGDQRANNTANSASVEKTAPSRFIRAIGNAYVDGKGRKKISASNWDVTETSAFRADLRRAKRQAEDHIASWKKPSAHGECRASRCADRICPIGVISIRSLPTMDAAPGETDVTVLHIDLEPFQGHHDTLGHAAAT